MQAMKETIEFNSVKYHRYPEASTLFARTYFKSTRDTLLHREIYRDHHGSIPDGFHVHHVDHDARNNNVDNLQALSPSDHAKAHASSDGAWIKTAEGRRKLSEASSRAWAVMPMVECQCKECGVTFEVKARQRSQSKFCGNPCKNRAYRARKKAAA